jgi:hypothetical protein
MKGLIYPILGGILLLSGILNLECAKNEAYDKGFDNGVAATLQEMKKIADEMKDNCQVSAVPIINKFRKPNDTIIYFMSAKLCNELDSVYTERWKRGN